MSIVSSVPIILLLKGLVLEVPPRDRCEFVINELLGRDMIALSGFECVTA